MCSILLLSSLHVQRPSPPAAGRMNKKRNRADGENMGKMSKKNKIDKTGKSEPESPKTAFMLYSDAHSEAIRAKTRALSCC
jgi:hypothetical protein